MISTVPHGRFYKIFVSPMLHKNPSQISLRGIFRILYPKKYPIFTPMKVKKDANICAKVGDFSSRLTFK